MFGFVVCLHTWLSLFEFVVLLFVCMCVFVPSHCSSDYCVRVFVRCSFVVRLRACVSSDSCFSRTFNALRVSPLLTIAYVT